MQAIIWDVVENYLPELKKTVEEVSRRQIDLFHPNFLLGRELP